MRFSRTGFAVLLVFFLLPSVLGNGLDWICDPAPMPETFKVEFSDVQACPEFSLYPGVDYSDAVEYLNEQGPFTLEYVGDEMYGIGEESYATWVAEDVGPYSLTIVLDRKYSFWELEVFAEGSGFTKSLYYDAFQTIDCAGSNESVSNNSNVYVPSDEYCGGYWCGCDEFVYPMACDSRWDFPGSDDPFIANYCVGWNGEATVTGAAVPSLPYLLADRRARGKKTIYFDNTDYGGADWAANISSPVELEDSNVLYLNGEGENGLDDKLVCAIVVEGSSIESLAVEEITVEDLAENAVTAENVTMNCGPSAENASDSECRHVFEDTEALFEAMPVEDGRELKCKVKIEEGDEALEQENPVALIERNIRDSEKYGQKDVFLVSDYDWGVVLEAVPATSWKEDGDTLWCNTIYNQEQQIETEKCAYPLLTYHQEGENFDAESIYRFIGKYDPGEDKVVHIEGYEAPATNVLNSIWVNKERVGPRWWKDKWKEKGLLVLVDGESYRDGLYASQLASYLNAPLVVLGEGSLEDLKGLITPEGDKAYSPKMLVTVGEIGAGVRAALKNDNLLLDYDSSGGHLEYNRESFDAATFFTTDTGFLNELYRYMAVFAAKTGETPEAAYQRMSSKAILVNSKDMLPSYCENFADIYVVPPFHGMYETYLKDLVKYTPMGSPGPVSDLYCKDSLAVPPLAIAKDERIFSTESGPGPGLDPIGGLGEPGEQEIAGLFLNEPRDYISGASYLTVVASPIAATYSLWKHNFDPVAGRPWYGPTYDHRVSLDRVRATKPGGELIPFGRIFAKTVSGVSAYIQGDIHGIRSSGSSILALFPHQTVDEKGGKQIDRPSAFYPALEYNTGLTDCYGDVEVLENYQVANCSGSGSLESPVPRPPAYGGNEIIAFNDHGRPDAWLGAIKARELPDLDSPVMVSFACSTAGYETLMELARGKTPYLFAPTAIEKGALGYFGYVGAGSWDDHYKLSDFMRVDEGILRLLFKKDGGSNYDLGTVTKKALENSILKLSDVTFLGDPTIKVNLPEISSPYFLYSPFNDFPNLHYAVESTIHYRVANEEGAPGLLVPENAVNVKWPEGTQQVNATCEPAPGSQECSFNFTPPLPAVPADQKKERPFYFNITATTMGETAKGHLFLRLYAEPKLFIDQFNVTCPHSKSMQQCFSGETAKIQVVIFDSLGASNIDYEKDMVLTFTPPNSSNATTIPTTQATCRFSSSSTEKLICDYSFQIPEDTETGVAKFKVNVKNKQGKTAEAELEVVIGEVFQVNLTPTCGCGYGYRPCVANPHPFSGINLIYKFFHFEGVDKINFSSINAGGLPVPVRAQHCEADASDDKVLICKVPYTLPAQSGALDFTVVASDIDDRTASFSGSRFVFDKFMVHYFDPIDDWPAGAPFVAKSAFFHCDASSSLNFIKFNSRLTIKKDGIVQYSLRPQNCALSWPSCSFDGSEVKYGVTCSFGVDSLAPGEYDVTVIARDKEGATVSKTVRKNVR